MTRFWPTLGMLLPKMVTPRGAFTSIVCVTEVFTIAESHWTSCFTDISLVAKFASYVVDHAGVLALPK